MHYTCNPSEKQCTSRALSTTSSTEFSLSNPIREILTAKSRTETIIEQDDYPIINKSMQMFSSSLGPLVRLEGISINQLPPEGIGADAPTSSTSGATTSNDLKTFITNVIAEALPFIDGVAPKSGGTPHPSWKKKGSAKRYKSSEAPVYMFKRRVAGKELREITGQRESGRKKEAWFCRRSCHRNASEKGTASWEEFRHHMKELHLESEDAFTPTIIGAREAIKWDTNDIEVEDPYGHGRWANITLTVAEMTHKIDPKPLKNRTFPVLQLATQLGETEEIIVVSIPLRDFDKSPHAQFARDKNLVVAKYTAVERIRILPESGEIEWIMATASDAGGVLPQWLQNLAVPGKIAHDVDLFLTWIRSQR